MVKCWSCLCSLNIFEVLTPTSVWTLKLWWTFDKLNNYLITEKMIHTISSCSSMVELHLKCETCTRLILGSAFARHNLCCFYYVVLTSLTKVTSDQIHQRPRASSVSGGAQCCGASPSHGTHLFNCVFLCFIFSLLQGEWDKKQRTFHRPF